MHSDWIKIWIKPKDFISCWASYTSAVMSSVWKNTSRCITGVKTPGLSIDLNSSLRCLHRHLSEFPASPVKLLTLQQMLKHTLCYCSLRWHYYNAYQLREKINPTKHFSTNSSLSAVKGHLDLTKHPHLSLQKYPPAHSQTGRAHGTREHAPKTTSNPSRVEVNC